MTQAAAPANAPADHPPIQQPRTGILIANLGTALVASLIIAAFGAAIEQLVALAILMPVVASIGGNAGTQTMAVSVRALAMNQLTRSNTSRVIWREMRVKTSLS